MTQTDFSKATRPHTRLPPDPVVGVVPYRTNMTPLNPNKREELDSDRPE